jgi:hypothetical protein
MLSHLPDDAGARQLRLFDVACCRRVLPLFPGEFLRLAEELNALRLGPPHRIGAEDATRVMTALDRALLLAEQRAEGATPPEREREGVAEAFRQIQRWVYDVTRPLRGWRADLEADVDRAFALLRIVEAVGDALDGEGRRDVCESCAGAVRYARNPAETVVYYQDGVLFGSDEEELAAQAELLRDVCPFPSRKRLRAPLSLRRGGPARKRAEAIYREGRFADMPALGDALQQEGCQDQEVLDHCRQARPHIRGCWVLDLVLEKRPDRPSLLRWRALEDPEEMLRFLGEEAGPRERCLFAAACCRLVEHLLDDPGRAAVAAAERFADGHAGREELDAARTVAADAALQRERLFRATSPGANPTLDPFLCAAGAAVAAAQYPQPDVVEAIDESWRAARESAPGEGSERDQGALVRDLFDGLFHPQPLDPAWLAWNEGTIPKLAQAFYEERAFDRMSVLGDALEEAGCADDVLLSRCRHPGLHARGCWLIDRILGRKNR